MKKKKNNKKQSKPIINLSEVAERYGLRISSPQGYFPEDVDEVIQDLENKLVLSTKELDKMKKERDKAVKDKLNIDNEYAKLKFELSMFEIPNRPISQQLDAIETLSNFINDKNPSNVYTDTEEVVDEDFTEFGETLNTAIEPIVDDVEEDFDIIEE